MASKQPVAGSNVRFRRRPANASRSARWRIRLPALAMPAIDARARKIALALTVVAFAIVGVAWLYHSPVLAIHGVSVEGNVVISDDAVREVAGLDGDRLARPDLEGAQQRLEAIPLVKTAEVKRDWPMGASVTIVERQAWGVWQIGEQRYVIDSEGVVLSAAGAAECTRDSTARSGRAVEARRSCR